MPLNWTITWHAEISHTSIYFKNVDFPGEGSAQVVIVATRSETRTDAGLAGEHDACRAPPFLMELQYAIEHFVVRLGDDDLASHCVPGSIQERNSFVILPEGHNVGEFLLRLEGVSKPLVIEFLDCA